jgi:hypothetical protein
MASGGPPVATGQPIRNEKIPKSQQRSVILESVACQLRDAAQVGASASIASICNFLNKISDGTRNPRTNMNAMRNLVDSAVGFPGPDEDAVLFRSGDVRACFPRNTHTHTHIYIFI